MDRRPPKPSSCLLTAMAREGLFSKKDLRGSRSLQSPVAADLAAYPFYANISEDFERRLDEGVRKLPPMTSKVKLPKAS